MNLPTLKTHITNLKNWAAGATDYATDFLAFLSGVGDVLQTLTDGKAEADHEHVTGGTTIITRTNSPVATGYKYLNLNPDNDSFELIDTDGSVLSRVAHADIDSGDAGMGVVVKADGSGWELGTPPPIMLPLALWQTLSTEKTVEAQDAEDTDGHGADLAYHFVFKDAQDSAMYIVVPVDFAGLDLRLVVPYCMSTSASGDVYWTMSYIAVSPGDTQAALANNAAWLAAGTEVSLAHTPNATASVLSELNSSSFKIPKTAYEAGDYLHIMLMRDGDHASDTRTGNAKPLDAIRLKPVVP